MSEAAARKRARSQNRIWPTNVGMVFGVITGQLVVRFLGFGAGVLYLIAWVAVLVVGVVANFCFSVLAKREQKAAQAADPPAATVAKNKRARRRVGVLAAVGIGVVAAATVAAYFRWIEPENTGVTDEMVRSFSHGRRLAHGTPPKDQFWHVYENSDGRADNALHRHCPTHDVNGDGDTDDAEDNDGTCPGPNTDLPDLPWHPLPPDPGDSFWKDAQKRGILTAMGAMAATPTPAPTTPEAES